MTIIVTGGAGFIGSNFVFHMLKEHEDYRIICLDKLTYAGNLSTLKSVMDNQNFRFVKADICDREAVEKLFEEEKPDIVVNFAAESHVDRSIENPEIFLQTNIIGTEVLMDACRKYGVQRYHQVSTDEVYGDLPLDRPDLFFTEETPIHTSSPYSSSKAGADLLVLAYHRTYGLPVTISRCSNNYGPYHFPEKLIMSKSWHPGKAQTAKKRGELSNIKSWLDTHYSEKISLDELAKRFYIDKYYLSKIFKEQYGITINAYISRKKITAAKQLLRFSDKSIEQIGFEIGISDTNYFTRLFKKIEGITPGEYRKRW